MRFALPAHAHVPGANPRHADDAFDALRRTARPGLAAEVLAQSDAWRAGWEFLKGGFFWEAHEVWEPVWMALPEASDERRMVRAAIQTANAALKLEMDQPGAVLRLCAMVEDLLNGLEAGEVMQTDPQWLRDYVQSLRRRANLRHRP
ncbi:MAG: DUF309 domain-containing protein [Jhaorihella sp.]